MVKNALQGETNASPDSPDEPPLQRRWFAVYTTCRHEKSVARHFERRDIEHYLPLYRAQRTWKNGNHASLDLPLFPGYVFIRLFQTEQWRAYEVPGVLRFVGNGTSRATPLPDVEIETLRTALDPLRVGPHPPLAKGERVRICKGALTGLEGTVVRQCNSVRVVITLELIMQSIAVEVNAEDVEPLQASLSRSAICP